MNRLRYLLAALLLATTTTLSANSRLEFSLFGAGRQQPAANVAAALQQSSSGCSDTTAAECFVAAKSPITFEIPINEGGAVNIIGRQGSTEIEVIANMSRQGDTLVLDGLHFTKNAGESLGKEQLQEFAREFGRQQGAKEVVIQGAPRTTGANPGSTPVSFKVKVE